MDNIPEIEVAHLKYDSDRMNLPDTIDRRQYCELRIQPVIRINSRIISEYVSTEPLPK